MIRTLPLAIALVALPAAALGQSAAQQHAAATVAAMQADEKTVLTHGIMALPFAKTGPLPADAVPGAGYIAGVPRLGVPALRETDASLGVAWANGIRNDGATALPSGLAQAATWNPALIEAGGAMIGSEARAKGFNVMLAGGANLVRDPRGGRSFEYLSEDPWLTGTLVGAAITGIQSNHLISTIKHFALNAQESGRHVIDARIGEAAARESDLLAFEIGIERGHPGAVMCAYNRVNGQPACGSDWLLNTVLKRDWRYPGFVMSDWGAVPGPGAALNGLDQQSGEQLDKAVWFDRTLAAAAARDPALAARIDDMNRRILSSVYAAGLDRYPATPGGAIDEAAHAQVALDVARQAIVLLRNQGGVLPLAPTTRSIAVIGGHALQGVLSGGGSSQVDAKGGPAVRVPLDGPRTFVDGQHYQGPGPVAELAQSAPDAKITYRSSAYIADAVEAARKADVAIVFATKWSGESRDVPDLSLPDGQDALIAAVAAANPRTVVVLETGNPVAMPWLDKVSGVIEAWYPGARGAQAIAEVLSGKVNPSGHLPVTFPADLAQLPRPVLDGYATLPAEGDGPPSAIPPSDVAADYRIEGSDVGYRWFARTGAAPLFPFGFGLSYTGFAQSGLTMQGLTARVEVRNTGNRAGATVAQVYLVSRPDGKKLRLVGYQRVELAPGESRTVVLAIDPRVIADWTDKQTIRGWSLAAGDYGFASGADAGELGPVVTQHIAARTWRD